MANLFRLIVAVLLLTAGLIAQAATVNKQPGWVWASGSQASDGLVYPSAAAACQKAQGTYPDARIRGFLGHGIFGDRCLWRGPPNADGSLTQVSGHAAYFGEGCPVGTTPNAAGTCDVKDDTPTQCEGGRERDASGQCACKAGTKEPPGGVGMCIPDGDPDPNQTDDKKCEQSNAMRNIVGVDRVGRVSGKQPLGVPSRVCGDSGQKGADGQPLGCAMEFTAETSFLTQSGWVSEGEGIGITNGPGLACVLGLDKDPDNPADADKVPEVKKPDDKCRNGFAGSVNGVSVCIDRGTTEQNGVDWNRVTDGNGNQTDVKTEVSCKGDKCVVTQTKTPVGGSTSTTSTTNVDRAQYCRSNPKTPVCNNVPTGGNTGGSGSSGNGSSGGGGNGNGDGEGEEEKSSFGGSCSAGWTCEGDAIMCAVAREQHKQNCKLFDESKPDPDYKKSVDGSDDKSAEALKSSATQVSVSQLDQNGLGWGRSCPADVSFEVVGRSFSIPFSKVCPILNVMALAALGLTLLSCLLWVVGKKD